MVWWKSLPSAKSKQQFDDEMPDDGRAFSRFGRE